jgi:alpha,alpha-trehalase
MLSGLTALFLKSFYPNVLRSDGKQEVCIKGTYHLANLLQELFHAQKRGERYLELEHGKVTEDPVHRLERLISNNWWNNLTRTIDASGIAIAARDPKSGNVGESPPRIYVPRGAPNQHAYYSKIAREKPEMRLDVQWLPKGDVTAGFIRSLNDKPGILALEMEEDPVTKELKGLPFIVPGGRFNELYNWDSCFCAISMIKTHPLIVKSILRHFIFETMHYGKILNANRSYYLGRAQPPFLTDLALRTYRAMWHEPGSKDLLKHAILAAMKEYHNYWMMPPRYDEESGLTRYRPIGFGVGPETPAAEFAHILGPYAEKYNMTIDEVGQAYTDGKIKEPELDRFYLHDRALRESGHDTTKRLEGVCADLGTIDLNCLLYRYETDIADTIRTVFDDRLEVPAAFCAPGQVANRVDSSAVWDRASKRRKVLIDKYCWNEEKGSYFDYNTVTKKQTDFEYVTCLWPLWCGVASPHQAALLVEKALPKFECVGGLSTSTAHSRGPINAKNPPKQWDYPYGWAPHQILAWDGLGKYGYHKVAERLIYKWLHMMTRVFVDYNGTVVEKYDVTQLKAPHKVTAEYGNQGLGFRYAPQEG